MVWNMRACDKEVTGSESTGLVGLHMQGALTGKGFPISRNWLTLEGASKSLEVRKHQNTENKRHG